MHVFIDDNVWDPRWEYRMATVEPVINRSWHQTGKKQKKIIPQPRIDLMTRRNRNDG